MDLTIKGGASIAYFMGVWVALLGLALCPYEPMIGTVEAALGFVLAVAGAVKSP